MNYKKIYDPLHGFIRFSSLEKQLIDSYVFQRLHYIHQLGVAYLVYPGATHTRFEHSIGVMELATQVFDRILVKYPDENKISSVAYWRQIIRFSALCHDLGHLPFSHLAEHQLLGKGGHEKWTIALIQSSYLSPIWEQLQKKFPQEKVLEDLLKVSIGEDKLQTLGEDCKNISFSDWDRVMSQVIAGDFFGSDRIDYLLRDARCTGVAYGLFDHHQLIEMLRILPCSRGKGWTLTLGIEENGIESCEALLLARHFMHKRVYQHPSVQAHSFHMARFMEKLYAKERPLETIEQYISYTDNEILQKLRLALHDRKNESYEDAAALLTKSNRYKAIQLPNTITQQAIDDWRKQYGISPEEAEVVLVENKEEKSPFSFPVMTPRNIVDAKECSELSIPSFRPSWLYLAPRYEHHLGKLLR